MKLTPFSSSPFNVEAKLEVQTSGFLLSFEVTGPGIEQILVQTVHPKPMRKNELWKETCFECFFGVGGSKQYFEFNGSTSGDWAFYSFEDYRNGMKDATLSANPVLEKLEKTKDRILCIWKIPHFTKTILQSASVTAILKTGNGAEDVSYWALKHAGAKPDFHLRESFIHRFI